MSTVCCTNQRLTPSKQYHCGQPAAMALDSATSLTWQTLALGMQVVNGAHIDELYTTLFTAVFAGVDFSSLQHVWCMHGHLMGRSKKGCCLLSYLVLCQSLPCIIQTALQQCCTTSCSIKPAPSVEPGCHASGLRSY